MPSDFSLREVDIPVPGPGQLLVANEYLSVDPAMRGRMSDKKSYIEPYEVGAPMDGPAVGRVLASNAEGFAVGDHVTHLLGWRDYSVIDAVTAQKVDPNLAPLTAYVGVLGITGLSAYIGLERFAKIREGDTVFVSGAAGAVGSQVGQIAKLKPTTAALPKGRTRTQPPLPARAEIEKTISALVHRPAALTAVASASRL